MTIHVVPLGDGIQHPGVNVEPRLLHVSYWHTIGESLNG